MQAVNGNPPCIDYGGNGWGAATASGCCSKSVKTGPKAGLHTGLAELSVGFGGCLFLPK